MQRFLTYTLVSTRPRSLSLRFQPAVLSTQVELLALVTGYGVRRTEFVSSFTGSVLCRFTTVCEGYTGCYSSTERQLMSRVGVVLLSLQPSGVERAG